MPLGASPRRLGGIQETGFARSFLSVANPSKRRRSDVAKRLMRYEDLPTKGIFYSKTQVWRLEKRGQFPRRVPIGPGRHGWVEDEIDQFIADRIAARDAANGS
jgi:prophage regulatory protein